MITGDRLRSYFVTGGTGFIGHYLIELLLKRRGNVYVLVRKGSMGKLDAFKSRWGKAASKIIPVTGDLTKSRLGISAVKRKELEGKIDHFFHLAVIYKHQRIATRLGIFSQVLHSVAPKIFRNRDEQCFPDVPGFSRFEGRQG